MTETKAYPNDRSSRNPSAPSPNYRQRNERIVLSGALCVTVAVILWLLVGTNTSDSVAESDSSTNRVLSRFEGPVETRRAHLSALPPVELEVIHRRRQKLVSLSEVRREQVQTFHEELMEHPNKEELQKTLNRYYIWLRSLSQKEQRRILESTGIEQLNRIKSLREEQAKASFGMAGATKLPEVDVSWVYTWIIQTVAEKKTQIDELLNSPDVKKRLPKLALNTGRPARSKGLYNYRFKLLAEHAPEYAKELVFEEMDKLRSGLSLEAREIINSLQVADQKELLLQWFLAALFARERVTDADLFEFWSAMSPERRETFEMFSREEWRVELKELYKQRMKFNNGRARLKRKSDRL